MKYLNNINEFRTIGFKYSEPSVRINVVLFCKGELDKEQFSALMDYLEVKFENFSVFEDPNKIEIEDQTVEFDIVVEFDLLVYNKSEVETITEEIRNGLNREFDVQTLQMFYKPAPVLNFKKK